MCHFKLSSNTKKKLVCKSDCANACHTLYFSTRVSLKTPGWFVVQRCIVFRKVEVEYAIRKAKIRLQTGNQTQKVECLLKQAKMDSFT